MSTREPLGFTLLELMVAIAIMGVVLVLGYSGMHMGMRHWALGQRQVDFSMERRNLLDFLRRQFGQALIRSQSTRVGAVSSFEGGPQRLRFVAPLGTYLEEGGLYEFWILVEGSEGAEDGLQLIMEFQRLDPDRPLFRRVDPKRLVLAESLKRVEFSYYGAIPPVDLLQWHNHWRETNALPMLIGLKLESLAQGSWPKSVFPVRGRPR